MTGVDEKRLREALLRHLARQAPGEPMGEMAREVLAGRMTMAAAVGSLAYGEHFAAAAVEGAQLMRSLSPAELAEVNQTLAVAASILDPPVSPVPPQPQHQSQRRRPDSDDDWDESVTSPWDQS